MATFVFAKGEIKAIPYACMIGRDVYTLATTVGARIGALHGGSGLPKDWVDTVCEVNLKEIDIHSSAEKSIAQIGE